MTEDQAINNHPLVNACIYQLELGVAEMLEQASLIEQYAQTFSSAGLLDFAFGLRRDVLAVEATINERIKVCVRGAT